MAKANVKTTDKDKGRNRILNEIDVLKGSYVTIGVHSEAPPYPSGQSVQFVATENEFGNSRIPERSFLRSTFDENRDTWRKKHRILLNAVIKGRTSTKLALRALGFEMATATQNKIITLQNPPNAQSTIDRKPLVGNNPLINTRHLLNNVGFETTVSKGKSGVSKGGAS